jgi:hypothetical protein
MVDQAEHQQTAAQLVQRHQDKATMEPCQVAHTDHQAVVAELGRQAQESHHQSAVMAAMAQQTHIQAHR